MTYTTQDAQNDIDTLNSFWAGDVARGITVTGTSYRDVIDIMKSLVEAGAYDPTIKMMFAAQGVFTSALTLEASSEDFIQQVKTSWALTGGGTFDFSGDAKNYYAGGPRYYMLTALKQAILGGFWATDPDPTGLSGWVGLVDPAGAAIAHTIGYDPEIITRGAALDLLKSVNWPVTWSQALLGGLSALDDAIASSGWSQQDRASLSALSKDVRARALTAANAAQSHNFKTVIGADGNPEDITIDAPGKPWYKSGPTISAMVLGVTGGVMIAAHKAKSRQ